MSPDPIADRFQRIRERPVALEVQGLTKRFAAPDGGERTALGDVSFTIHRREFVTVIGPSGCGKSTLVRLLAGLEEPSAGAVLIDGKPVDGPGRDRGMVFQGYTLFPWRTVMANVMFGLEMGGMGGDLARSEALEWLDLVGLADFANHYPSQLSGGMKQRVAIARALANRPRVLLMDEPFGALDPRTRVQMQSHLLQIWRNVPVTIVFITHDLDEAVMLGDRVLVLGAPDATHSCGYMREFVEVPLPQPRDIDILRTEEFRIFRDRLDALVHPHEAVTVEKLPMVRMTQVGDDV